MTMAMKITGETLLRCISIFSGLMKMTGIDIRYGDKYLQVLESLGDKEPAEIGREVCEGVSPATTVHWQHLDDHDDLDVDGGGEDDNDEQIGDTNLNVNDSKTSCVSPVP